MCIGFAAGMTVAALGGLAGAALAGEAARKRAVQAA
jgi:hypothetical protein